MMNKHRPSNEILETNVITGIFRPRGVDESRHQLLRLNKNECLSRPNSTFLREFKGRLTDQDFLAYPEVEPLYRRLAQLESRDVAELVLTAGAEAAIRMCFSAFVRPGDKVVSLSPTFQMVNVFCELHEAVPIKITQTKPEEINVESFLRSLEDEPTLMIIANPNSPTGAHLKIEELERIIADAELAGTIVLIDETYFEFSSLTCSKLIPKYENLVICRSLSKGFGLAGCRMGYLMSQSRTAGILYQFKAGWEVNQLGILAAHIMLDNPEIIHEQKADVEAGRQRLEQICKLNGWPYYSPLTNFMHIDFGNQIERIRERAKEQNISLDGGPSIPGYESWMRVTLGSPKVLQPFVDLLLSLNLTAR